MWHINQSWHTVNAPTPHAMSDFQKTQVALLPFSLWLWVATWMSRWSWKTFFLRLPLVKLGARVKGGYVYSIAASKTRNRNILRTLSKGINHKLILIWALFHVEVRTEICSWQGGSLLTAQTMVFWFWSWLFIRNDNHYLVLCPLASNLSPLHLPTRLW